MKLRSVIAVAFALVLTGSLAFAQTNPGTSPLSIPKGGTSAGTASGARTSLGLTIGSAVEAWDADLDCFAALSGTGILRRTGSGTCSNGTTTTIAEGGTGQGTQQAAFNALAPTPTRAGDITYWNGTNYVNLAGNNSGTQFLQENASGVPSWATVAGTGTVTSIICGTGLSGGTITTSGTCAINLSVITNSLGSDIALNNTANYFDGPSVAQGASGTWWASGNASVLDSVSGSLIFCKLWDGTTVVDSGVGYNAATGVTITVHLSGYLASPAGNLKISCRDSTTTNGLIKFNASGNSKDSTLSAHRIQ